MSNLNNLIEVKNICFNSKNISILENISFDVEKGDYISIIGPNGSGKSSLIKILLGIIDFGISGKINLNNITLSDIGYLPQANSFKPKNFPAKVYEIISTGLLSKKKFPKFLNSSDLKKIDAILKRINIFHLKDRIISDLSGGEQQKVLLARALISNPKLILLDEPTSALDLDTRNNFYSLLKELNEKENITILFITHDIENIKKNSKKVLYLDKKILFFGNTEAYQEEKNV
ncbi:metal ABC transporter ATP-binding protein [Cetobacterium sp. 2A]|uniref:metal ABC transporter ATP-binding protein n=1 Tax=Cetobacterium sp. 2A TaxID=2754723 RepID=UPI00163C0658|nr:metal ABC transporter ATP-binding protein [Cetobacterium sp. 2A]MBC2855153.1 metal ABC transporter ATP-binding protein [Cetobacterium sp. 2A]